MEIKVNAIMYFPIDLKEIVMDMFFFCHQLVVASTGSGPLVVTINLVRKMVLQVLSLNRSYGLTGVVTN